MRAGFILCLVMRLKVEDSAEFQAISKTSEVTSRAPFEEDLTRYPKALAKVTSISLVQNLGTYFGTVFVAVYFSEVLGFTKGESSTIVLLAVLFAALLVPMAGQLGNRIGSKKVLLWADSHHLNSPHMGYETCQVGLGEGFGCLQEDPFCTEHLIGGVVSWPSVWPDG